MHVLRSFVVAGRAVVALVVVLGLRHALVLAQEPQKTFTSVPGGAVVTETLAAGPLVFIAYGFVWVALLVYIFMLWRRTGKVEAELLDLTNRLHSGKRG
jgi:CcmD family protein